MAQYSREHPRGQVSTDFKTVLPYSWSSEQPDTLHIFADASLTAYGAVAFLCSGNNTSFVMAKSRVAPLKSLTLPKLELMGALTAARLCDFIVQVLRPLTLLTHFWSDSQIILHWIKGEKRTGTFVTHRRVTEILKTRSLAILSNTGQPCRPSHQRHYFFTTEVIYIVEAGTSMATIQGQLAHLELLSYH